VLAESEQEIAIRACLTAPEVATITSRPSATILDDAGVEDFEVVLVENEMWLASGALAPAPEAATTTSSPPFNTVEDSNDDPEIEGDLEGVVVLYERRDV
jgi:hypothetical protein